MKRFGLFVGVLMAGLAVASMAQAISQGPGGRLYMTGRASTNAQYTSLRSLVIDQNWDYVGAVGGFNLHGQWTDNFAAPFIVYSKHNYGGISPEIYTYGGDQGWATLVVGAYWNNYPKAGVINNQTMDVLKIQTSNGSHAVTLLGDGAINPNMNYGWYGGGSPDQYPATERASFAMPDYEGGFTGDAKNCYVLGDAYDRYAHTAVLTDRNNDGDITDDQPGKPPVFTNSDYLYAICHDGYGDSHDQEILANRLYYSPQWSGTWQGSPGNGLKRGWLSTGLKYVRRNADNTMTTWTFIQSVDNVLEYTPPAGCLHGLQLPAGQGVAVTKIQNHHTAYAVIEMRNWLDPGGTLTALAKFIDLNDDGDAMDNDLGECQIIFRSDSSSLKACDNPGAGWVDMEIVENEAGKKFLLILQEAAYNIWSNSNDSLLVLELDDNGNWVGSSGIKIILYEGSTIYGGDTGWGRLGTEIEFDSNLKVVAGEPIPEPTTLLLIGSGVLGVIGYIRRRRTM